MLLKLDYTINQIYAMMSFKQKLKSQRKLNSTRIKYNMDRLKNKSTQVDYREYIEDKLDEELTNNENENIERTITALNRIIHQVATDKLGFSRKKNKPWITDDILELCDERRKLKPQKNERRREYNLLNKNIKNGMRKRSKYGYTNNVKVLIVHL